MMLLLLRRVLLLRWVLLLVDSSAVEVHIAVQTDIAPVTDAPHMACLVVYRRYGVAGDYRYIAAMDSGEDRVTHLILWKTTPWQRD